MAKRSFSPSGQTDDAPANELVPEALAEISAPVEAPAPAAAPLVARPHHTVCTVVGSAVVSEGREYPVGAVHDFADSDVLSLPEILIPV